MPTRVASDPGTNKVTDIIFKAAKQVGFKQMNFKLQYPNPDFADEPSIKRYLDTCNPTDYIFIFKKHSN